ncbi:MAG: mycothiol system anti-sigma-R factor [Angustibacter sp.]
MSECDQAQCAQVLQGIFAYLDGELAQLDCELIAQHLDTCPGCAQEYTVDCALKAVIKRSCSGESAPQELRDRVVAGLATLRACQPHPETDLSS